MTCVKCGYKSSNKIKFCPICGGQMVEGDSSESDDELISNIAESKSSASYVFKIPKAKMLKIIWKHIASSALSNYVTYDGDDEIWFGNYVNLKITKNMIFISKKSSLVKSGEVVLRYGLLVSILNSLDECDKI